MNVDKYKNKQSWRRKMRFWTSVGLFITTAGVAVLCIAAWRFDTILGLLAIGVALMWTGLVICKAVSLKEKEVKESDREP